MRHLLDMGVAVSTAAHLRQLGHDAVHLAERRQQRLADPDILKLADSESRIVVTFDLDFPRLLAL